MTAKRKKIDGLLEGMYLWMVMGSDKSVEEVRLTDDEVRELLVSGEGPWRGPWQGMGQGIYWGKLYHRCSNDLARCEEEVHDLGVEKLRLMMWLESILMKVVNTIATLEKGTGRCILLGRWEARLKAMRKELSDLKW